MEIAGKAEKARQAAAHGQERTRWAGLAVDSNSAALRRRATKCSIRSALAAEEAVARVAARPPPKRGFDAALASAPPVKERPARLSASATASTVHTVGRLPRAAKAPTVRKRAPFTTTWFAA